MSHGRNNHSDTRQDDDRSLGMYDMLAQGRSFSGHERNCCFLNTMGAGKDGDRFATISAVSGLDYDDDGRALVWSDWDQDGDLDAWISNRTAPRMRFFRNESSSGNRFLLLKLVGNGNDTNRDAIGARVAVVYRTKSGSAAGAQPRRLIKTLRAGEGFVSQQSAWLHFGLGESAEIEHVYVTWPNAQNVQEDFGAVTPDGRYVLVQGSGEARSSPARTDELALRPGVVQAPPDDMLHRIPLLYPLQVSAMGYFDFAGEPRDIHLNPDQVTLINLWSTTCKPCVKELGEFVRRSEELKAAGVRVIAISIDALESGDADAVSSAKAMAEQLKIPFEVGMAAPGVIQDLQLLHDALIHLNRPLPMPSSFLINRKGELDIIYKGPVEVDTLLADAKIEPMDFLARYEFAAALPGRVVDDPVVEGALMKSSAMVHYKRAKQLIANEMFDGAIEEYKKILEVWPDSGTAHHDFGVLLILRGDFANAVEQLTRARELKPDDPEIHFNLAVSLERAGRLEDAMAAIEQAIQRFPKYADIHYGFGVIKLRMGDVEGAKRGFNGAIELNPRHERALVSLGTLLMQTGELAAARNHLKKALEILPDEAVVLTTLSNVYVLERDWPEAERVLRSVVENQPQSAEARFRLGQVLAMQNQFPEAKRCFEETLRLNQNFPGAWAALQETLLRDTASN